MERLLSLRRARGYRQKDIADYLGVDRTTYTKYETGATEPNIATIRRLADLFSVTTDYLLGRTDTPDAAVRVDDLAVLSIDGEPVPDLTESERAELLEFARYLLSKRKKS